MSEESVQCDKCRVHACAINEPLKAPKFCPMKTREDVLDVALSHYIDDPNNQKVMAAASHTQIKGISNSLTRIEDIVNFAREMGYSKLGIASCAALFFELNILAKILEAKGFDITSICCKSGCNFEKDIGLQDGNMVLKNLDAVDNAHLRAKMNQKTGFPLCNPVGQAFLLNNEKTDLNILFGLCVGHDVLFIKHSEAPVTPLVVKDRATLNNPAAAIYGSNFFFSRLMAPENGIKD